MTDRETTTRWAAWRRSRRLFATATGTLAAAMLAGAWPTWRWAGADGLAAMGSAGAAAMMATLIGSAAMLGGLCRPGAASALRRALMAPAVRLGAAAAMALPIGLLAAAGVPAVPMLLWFAIGYLVTLGAETALLARWAYGTP